MAMLKIAFTIHESNFYNYTFKLNLDQSIFIPKFLSTVYVNFNTLHNGRFLSLNSFDYSFQGYLNKVCKGIRQQSQSSLTRVGNPLRWTTSDITPALPNTLT